MSTAENNRSITDRKAQEHNVSVMAYDLSIVEDFRARFKKPEDGKRQKVNDTVQITSPDRAFEIMGTLNQDKVIMPFISIQRENWSLNLDRQGYQTFIGEQIVTRIGPDNLPIDIRMQLIPITINYRLSVWTQDRTTNDALMRELLFYYHIHPSLLAFIPHGLNIAHKFNIYFNSEIEDNSDIANQVNRGQFFRQDITFYTDDAYLWHANYDQRVAVDPSITFNWGPSDHSGDNQKIEFNNLLG